ncbi:MAG: hypothetical protein S4CHLAM20_06640 [Chlamydiia bacterium]|nr:hypothetical protein [Chlamydiia bacterium]
MEAITTFLTPNVLSTFHLGEHVVKAGVVSVEIGRNQREFVPRGTYGHFSSVNQRILQRIIAGVLNISAAVVFAVKTGVAWVLTSMQKIAAVIHLQFLSVFGGFLSLIGSAIESFRLITKLENFKEKINFELDHAKRTHNLVKESKILKYKIATGVEIVSNFFTMASAVVSIVVVIGGISLNPVVLISMIAISFIVLMAAIIMKHAFKTDEIERDYFSEDIPIKNIHISNEGPDEVEVKTEGQASGE